MWVCGNSSTEHASIYDCVKHHTFSVTVASSFIVISLYTFFLCREVVMDMLFMIDPQAVEQRRQHRLCRRVYRNKVCTSLYNNFRCDIHSCHMQGPNFCWHMDGNDKLKPYGFSVHGCIDGYVHGLNQHKAHIYFFLYF